MLEVYPLNPGMMGVRIDPYIIEVFICSEDAQGRYQRLCNVRWSNGEVVANQGGLPIKQLQAIFGSWFNAT